MTGIAGTHLDERFLQDPQRPLDELLDWHFEQAVLTNMKGRGEPVFEHDFPPGSDMVGEILRGPKAPERMEFELFTRLGHLATDEREAGVVSSGSTRTDTHVHVHISGATSNHHKDCLELYMTKRITLYTIYAG